MYVKLIDKFRFFLQGVGKHVSFSSSRIFVMDPAQKEQVIRFIWYNKVCSIKIKVHEIQKVKSFFMESYVEKKTKIIFWTALSDHCRFFCLSGKMYGSCVFLIYLIRKCINYFNSVWKRFLNNLCHVITYVLCVFILCSIHRFSFYNSVHGCTDLSRAISIINPTTGEPITLPQERQDHFWHL